MAFPLHEAARQGDATAVVGLIGQGANLEQRDPSNRVALHLAAWAGHLGEGCGRSVVRGVARWRCCCHQTWPTLRAADAPVRLELACHLPSTTPQLLTP